MIEPHLQWLQKEGGKQEDSLGMDMADEAALEAAPVAEATVEETPETADSTALEAAEAAEEATELACRTWSGLALTAPMAASAIRDLPYMFAVVFELSGLVVICLSLEKMGGGEERKRREEGRTAFVVPAYALPDLVNCAALFLLSCMHFPA